MIVVRTDRATLDTLALALVGVALGTGVVLRAAPIAAEFPLGDGGLFWAMANELRANGFLPPIVTGYNGLDIPYVYPPLGLYLLALLGGDRMWLQILPVLFSVATIPAVWLLGRGLTSRRGGLIAAGLYAVSPWAYLGITEGGGITRAPGVLVAVLTLHAVVQRRPLQAGVGGGTLLLLHPLAAAYTLVGATVLWISRERDARTLVAIPVALAIGAVWWAPMVVRHGVEPLVAGLTSRGGASPSVAPMRFVYLLALPPNPAFILGTIGFVQAVRLRRWDLVAWAAIFTLGVGVAGRWAVIPFAILGGMAVDRALDMPRSLGSRAIAVVAVATAAMSIALAPASPALSTDERAVMTWVRDGTRAGTVVAVIGYPAAGGFVEWFPALSGRTNLTTEQGSEWSRAAQARTDASAVTCTEVACLPPADLYVLRPGCCPAITAELTMVRPQVYLPPD